MDELEETNTVIENDDEFSERSNKKETPREMAEMEMNNW
jgi:hypothetical protein